MKLITAMIQPYRLPQVKEELFKINVRKMTITNVLGCGQQAGFSESYRGTITEVNLIKKVRIEIAVSDEFETKTIDAIIDGAKTGNIGDGKIFVQKLSDCIRIRTGEKGKTAIG